MTHNCNWSFYLVATRQSCTEIQFLDTKSTLSRSRNNTSRCKFQGSITPLLRPTNSEVGVSQRFMRPWEPETCEKRGLKLEIASEIAWETLIRGKKLMFVIPKRTCFSLYTSSKCLLAVLNLAGNNSSNNLCAQTGLHRSFRFGCYISILHLTSKSYSDPQAC